METKPAFRTTEFWTALVVQLIMIANLTSIWNYMPNRYSALVMGFVQGLYMLSRGWAKSGVGYDPTKDPQPIAKKLKHKV